MIRFSKLKLNGFKSFIDRGELDITVGLTGIVGPNGCGKSNLVEALRWCMGESSARKMRGSGMDDVIFNGTERRPSRNFAEVTLLLDNQTREAPEPYNQYDEIEITRRITRDKGSNYKINGKNARARDVQLLFADTMTGANSPSLVSQGRVSEIINAKPFDRRQVLEESAGVAGLYARRHEAELRLKAAETNLTRLEDISESMQSRLETLKRQARQAERYKELNAEIRKLDRQIAYAEWHQSKKQQNNALKIYDTAESLVAEKMKDVTKATNDVNEQKRNLPSLRTEHTKLTATLHSQKIALTRLEEEEQKIINLLSESDELLVRTKDDLSYEQKTLLENKSLLEKVEQEEQELHARLGNEEDEIKPLQEAKANSEKKALALEEKHETLLQEIAAAKAKSDNLNNEYESLLNRLKKHQAKADELEQFMARYKQQQKELLDLNTLKEELDALTADLSNKEKSLTTLKEDIQATEQKRDAQHNDCQDLENALTALNAEKNTLETLLNDVDDNTVLDDIDANKGFETALSRALGDSLLASTDPDMQKIWRKLNKLSVPEIPKGCTPLINNVRAPDELSLALSFIGVADEGCDVAAAVKQLKPGQSIVSKSGDFWRWDGYHAKAESIDHITRHLQHKNRLTELHKELNKQELLHKETLKAYEQVKDLFTQKKQQLPLLSNEADTLKSNITEKQRLIEQESYKAQALNDKQTAAENNLLEVKAEIEQLNTAIEEKGNALKLAETQSAAEQAEKITALKDELLEARENYQSASFAMEKYIQEQNRRKARIHAIVDERNALKNRTIRGKDQIEKHSVRVKDLEQRIEDNKNKPELIDAEKNKLLDALSNIEEECTKASDKLSKAEMNTSAAEKNLKQYETELATARESRAAAQANVANAEEQLKILKQSIFDNYQCQPSALLNKAEYALGLDDSGQDIAKTFQRLRQEKESAVIKREKIGPVNLQAADELKEIDSELGSILKEREDLILAIDELRKAINTLNTEARARLLKTFDEVNEHFKALFTRLYRGGKAYLELVDSDDALDAGIEIFAQPPGKTLQSLSLMSGGEQTLASIALIFAMFLTNPSPICVLDEVDAPLDDANVDRVCDLLEEISAHGHTRFLVITHHRLTMARMDRLYGVTMAEQGVSQLVSVDLQQELDFLDDAA